MGRFLGHVNLIERRKPYWWLFSEPCVFQGVEIAVLDPDEQFAGITVFIAHYRAHG
jgi:hypothetical protein